MISQELSKQIGINALTEACNCRTPQGRRLKKRFALLPTFRAEWITKRIASGRKLAEFDRFQSSWGDRSSNAVEPSQGITRHTLSSWKRTLLDDTEFFELKSALKIFFRLNKLKTLLKSAGLHLMKNKDASRLLDPSGTGNPAFHIYSAYSPTLADIRDKKRKLEREITVEKAIKDKLFSGNGHF